MSDFDPYHQWLGIPVTERPVSKYRLLGIGDFESDRGVISAAAERQTIYLRTLQAGEHAVLVAELLNEVSRARVTLLNADQKTEYDEELRRQQTPEPDPEPIPAIPTPTPAPTPVVVRGTVTQESPVSIVQPAKRPRRRKRKKIWKRPAVIGVSLVGVIGVFVLVISMMSSEDADPEVSNLPPGVNSPPIPEPQLAPPEEPLPLEGAPLTKNDPIPEPMPKPIPESIPEPEPPTAVKGVLPPPPFGNNTTEAKPKNGDQSTTSQDLQSQIDQEKKMKAAAPAPNNSDLSGLWRNYKTETTFRYKQKGAVLTVELERSETLSFFSASFRIKGDRLDSTSYRFKFKGDPRSIIYRRKATGRIVDDSSIEMSCPVILFNRDGSIRAEVLQTATYLRVE